MCGDAQAHGVLHLRRAADVGQEQRLPVGSADVCARGGRLVVMQWAREHGCEWSEHTCMSPLGEGILRC